MEQQVRILVVDDDPDIVKALTTVLEFQRYVVTVARNGEECLAKIEQDRPDLIILDLLMPKLDGFGVVRELKENPRYDKYDSIPILVLTAVQERASRRRYELETGLEMDVDDYLEKPIQPMDLLHRVAMLVRKDRKGGETRG